MEILIVFNIHNNMYVRRRNEENYKILKQDLFLKTIFLHLYPKRGKQFINMGLTSAGETNVVMDHMVGYWCYRIRGRG
jgi:hypothetical protein